MKLWVSNEVLSRFTHIVYVFIDMFQLCYSTALIITQFVKKTNNHRLCLQTLYHENNVRLMGIQIQHGGASMREHAQKQPRTFLAHIAFTQAGNLDVFAASEL